MPFRRTRARIRIRLRRLRRTSPEAVRESVREVITGVRWEAGRRSRTIGQRGLDLGRGGGDLALRAFRFGLAIPVGIVFILAEIVKVSARFLAIWLDALGEILTPARAVAAVSVFAAGALIASQFADFHGVAVGQPGYEGEIGAVAPAPITDQKNTGTAHSYALIPVAAIAVLLILVTLRRNWRLGRLVALCGLVGLAVTLLIDLDKGLDAGRAGIAYVDADARLLEGFWAQLVSSVVLMIGGLMLASHARRASPTRARRRRRSRRRPKEEPGLARRLGWAR